MRPIQISFSATNSTVGGVAASQTPSGAGAVTINGTLAVNGVVTFATPQIVTIASTSDISNRTFTITGTDKDTNVISQSAITGPNNNTVSSTKYFYSVTGATISGAAAGAITMGTSGLAICKPIPLDMYASQAQVSVAVATVTAGTYKMQYTYDDIQATTWPNGTQNWTDDSNMTGKTSGYATVLTALPTAIRIVVTTAGSNVAITGQIVQPGPS